MEHNEIKLLSQLLNPHNNDVNGSQDDCEKSQKPKLDFPPVDKKNSYAPIDNKVKKPSFNDICEDVFETIQDNELVQYRKEWRNTPKWDIYYKQSVTPSDIYLQMGAKNPSTASCENMVINFYLPGESRHNIDLKVHKQQLEIVSPKFYLKMPLPQPVDPHCGNAEFDSDAEKLIVTLIMKREFDYINF